MLKLFVLLFIVLTVPGHAAELGDWTVDVVAKRYFSSHTSYEFGNPEPPYQVPLSRLEFPMNGWFGGVVASRKFDRFTFSGELLRNMSQRSDEQFKDSDWTGETHPTNVMDIYSESSMRFEPSYMARLDIDMRVDDWMPLPKGLDVRPVVGVRWQDLNLLSRDGVQVYPADPGLAADPLPGEGIRFSQKYWQYFLGARMAYDLSRHFNVPGLTLTGQMDGAIVFGKNRDHHLLRPGIRMTYENTRGNAWHALIGLSAPLNKNLTAGVAFEYLRIETTGDHLWTDSVQQAELVWTNGVKVWSEQMNLMFTLRYLF
ncbi:omptin family outer membrane protease [Rhodoferax sp.]|uniref:omptin family outer membrane protease n=1 Tax=Rhodoferax sp. TaxID=50421 RepID=UPI00260A8626|nr:omptin family outer membrane protease [Rhodoferax sp.]MDD2925845.1 omptin family outer membrane protease [Rhodoferax sp.]